MTEAELISELRVAVGNPEKKEVTDASLRRALVAALETVAERLEYSVYEDAQGVFLEDGVMEYPLPGDVARLLWVSWNGLWLTGRSTGEWRREGTDWRGATAASPSEYAVEGQKLILSPPPDDTAVEDDPCLMLRYVRSPPALVAMGTPLLSDANQRYALWHAALEWLGPRNKDGSLDRLILHAKEMIAMKEPAAKKRVEQPNADAVQVVGFGQSWRSPAR